MADPVLSEGVTRHTKPPQAKPAQLALQDSAGVTWFLWVATDGKLRISDTADTEETDFAAGGTVVGAQS